MIRNELVEKDFEQLIDAVEPGYRPLIASLMELIEAYENHDFTRGLSEVIPLLQGRVQPFGLLCLLRIAHYANELLRVELSDLTNVCVATQGDSREKGR